VKYEGGYSFAQNIGELLVARGVKPKYCALHRLLWSLHYCIGYGHDLIDRKSSFVPIHTPNYKHKSRGKED